MEQKRNTSLRLSNQPAKLIPRDINESLGKLPPQALDLEETVLGALMLEKPAIDQVKDFLRMDHFYSEAHKEIYNAIFALNRESAPIDMRTVRLRLAETGHLELVGGAFYIAELTSKVSSAANIEYHARKIVELALKRELIQIASQIHHEGYEDTSDVFEMLDRVTSTLLHIKETSVFDNSEEKIKALWKERQLLTEPPPEIPLISIDTVPVITVGNLSMISGKKKSRKTLYITWLIDQYFKQNHSTSADDILLFDTEQGKTHVWKVRERIHRLTGLELPIFFLRGMSPVARREFIANTCKYWPKRPRIIVIDGIRDLMSNINDPVETTEVLVWMEKVMTDNNVHVMNVLHQNKADKNPRGHIGTELMNKAEVNMELEKDEKTGLTNVNCESSREKEFEPFTFTHGADGLPEMMGISVADDDGHGLTKNEQFIKLRDSFEDEVLKREEVVTAMIIHFACSKSKAQKLLAQYVSKGWVMKSGKDRDPKTTYKLTLPELAPSGFIPLGVAKARQAVEEIPPLHPPDLFSQENDEEDVELPF